MLTPKLIGGTTTQNTDSEWSDARECYFATLLLDYYQQTKDFDYLERAVAAARSGLAVAPWENWAHNGYNDEHGSLTGFHWGTGSEMASVEMMTAFLGDAFIDVKLQRGVGFNACTIQSVAVTGHQISLTLNVSLTPRALLIRFSGLDPAIKYALAINGHQVATLDGATLLNSGYLANIGSQTNKAVLRPTSDLGRSQPRLPRHSSVAADSASQTAAQSTWPVGRTF